MTGGRRAIVNVVCRSCEHVELSSHDDDAVKLFVVEVGRCEQALRERCDDV